VDFAWDWVVAMMAVALDQLSCVFCIADSGSLCSDVISLGFFSCHKHADYDCAMLLYSFYSP
jgi:hypothetical protein